MSEKCCRKKVTYGLSPEEPKSPNGFIGRILQQSQVGLEIGNGAHTYVDNDCVADQSGSELRRDGPLGRLG